MHARTHAAAAIGAGLALALALPTAALAHDEVVDSTPTSGSTLTALPETFSVTMGADLADVGGGGSALQIRDADGGYYGDGCVAIDGPTLSTDASLGEAGDYTLLWQLVGSDGHTVSGEIPFSWAPEAGAPIDEPSSTPPDCGGTAAPGIAEPDHGEEPDHGTEPGHGEEPADALWIVPVAIGVLALIAIAIVVVVRRRPGATDGPTAED